MTTATGRLGDLSTVAEEGPGAFTRAARRTPPAEELGADSPAAIYIREINRTPLLTADEEIRLAQERGECVAAALECREPEADRRPEHDAVPGSVGGQVPRNEQQAEQLANLLDQASAREDQESGRED
jgi:Sigma-70 factor, region 1.2